MNLKTFSKSLKTMHCYLSKMIRLHKGTLPQNRFDCFALPKTLYQNLAISIAHEFSSSRRISKSIKPILPDGFYGWKIESIEMTAIVGRSGFIYKIQSICANEYE